jgi:hypothetical protein
MAFFIFAKYKHTPHSPTTIPFLKFLRKLLYFKVHLRGSRGFIHEQLHCALAKTIGITALKRVAVFHTAVNHPGREHRTSEYAQPKARV